MDEIRGRYTKDKGGILLVVTGLAVAYVRHGLEGNWGKWESIEQFLAGWFVHTMCLALFMAIAATAILRLHEFFLGTKRESDDFEELFYNVLMTVLVGTIFIFIIAHWSPSDGEF
jgi:hypothetical protein